MAAPFDNPLRAAFRREALGLRGPAASKASGDRRKLLVTELSTHRRPADTGAGVLKVRKIADTTGLNPCT